MFIETRVSPLFVVHFHAFIRKFPKMFEVNKRNSSLYVELNIQHT
ncbi:hypothetical protein QFZ77_002259 [Paenibacillus sp. V4I3]|nr:hypothetical protein [Paenibacillus sp. V4I3]